MADDQRIRIRALSLRHRFRVSFEAGKERLAPNGQQPAHFATHGGDQIIVASFVLPRVQRSAGEGAQQSGIIESEYYFVVTSVG